jgi:hypothetical protein
VDRPARAELRRSSCSEVMYEDKQQWALSS